MSYYAYDSSGYIGDAASVSGWADFVAWAQAQGGALEAFANSGESENVQALIEQLQPLKADDPDVESTRENLLTLAQKAKDVIYISDGFEDKGD